MDLPTYDEDLWANPFFVKLQQDHPKLYNSASKRGWLIAIPKADSLEKFKYSEATFLTHILLPADEEIDLWKTLSNKEVTIKNNAIKTGVGFSNQIEVAILFEETFYTTADTSYRVLCIGHSLEGRAGDNAVEKPAPIQITSLEDCSQLIWGQTGNQKTCRNLQQLIDLFNQTCVRLEGENLHPQVDAANVLFTKAMQIVLKDSVIKKHANGCISFMDTVKLAVETYVLHGVFNQLFRNILLCMGRRDSKLNKITRNLKEIQLKQLGVRAEFGELIPGARREFYGIPRFTTPLGKLNCVRRMMSALTDIGSHSPLRNEEPLALTSDDLLPILVFLIIKSDIPNWWANFVYMKYFRFSKTGNDDEYGFYLATLEAALDYVMGGDAIHLSNSPSPTSDTMVEFSVATVIEPIWKIQDTVEAKTVKLFECVADDNTKEVEILLNGQAPALEDIKGQLCHPLCECPKCSKLVAQTQIDPSLVTTYSRDHRGCTVLHVAAQKGYTEMTDLLVQHGAVVNATDYQGLTPLHQACQRGHQAVTLLLLHYKAQVNLQDNEGSTPLHLATANGHAECVKALVYYDQGATTLHMHIANDIGETALHLAAKWGYDYLVEILLENGSSVKVENRKRQTPLNVAHNLRVAYRLRKALQEEKEREERMTRQGRPSKVPMKRKDSVTSLVGSIASASDVGTPPSSRRSSVSSVQSHLGRDTRTPPRQTLPSSQNASEPSKSETEASLSETMLQKKPIDKLLKSVADGDTNMVKYHLGWTDEDLDSAEDVEKRDLCHPLCQCDKCQPLQKLATISPSGLHINCANDTGYTPLLMAALHGQVTLLELFVKAGANVNAKTEGQEYSPLHLACQSNSVNTLTIMKLLLEQGARVNHRDFDGNTAMHFCCLKGNVDGAELLLKFGASVNATNGKGNTPLHEAARWAFLPVCKLLLHHGASLFANRQNLTPIQVAQDPEIVKLLSGAKDPSEEGQGSRSPVSHEEVTLQGNEAKAKRSSSRSSREFVEDHSKLKEVFDALEDKDFSPSQLESTSTEQVDPTSSPKTTIPGDRSNSAASDLQDAKVTSGRSTDMTFDPDMRERRLRMDAVMEEAREMLEHNRGGFNRKDEKEYIESTEEELVDISPKFEELKKDGILMFHAEDSGHSSMSQNSAETADSNNVKCKDSDSNSGAVSEELRDSSESTVMPCSNVSVSEGEGRTNSTKETTNAVDDLSPVPSSDICTKDTTRSKEDVSVTTDDGSASSSDEVLLEASSESAQGDSATSPKLSATNEVMKSDPKSDDASGNAESELLARGDSSNLCSSGTVSKKVSTAVPDINVSVDNVRNANDTDISETTKSLNDAKVMDDLQSVSSNPTSPITDEHCDEDKDSTEETSDAPMNRHKAKTESGLSPEVEKAKNSELIRSLSAVSDGSDFDLFTAESEHVSFSGT